jgi:VanZ family protein
MNFRYAMLFVMLAGLNVYLSTVPHLGASIQNEVINQVLRKSAHVVIFALLTWFLWMALPNLNAIPCKKMLVCSSVLIAFAFIDEFLQTFTPGRRGNLIGFGFDLVGIFLALSALRWFGAMTGETWGSPIKGLVK